MHRLIIAAILLSTSLIGISQIPFPRPSYPLAPGHIDNPTVHDEIPDRYVFLWQGIPFADYALIGLSIVWIRLVIEKENEKCLLEK